MYASTFGKRCSYVNIIWSSSRSEEVETSGCLFFVIVVIFFTQQVSSTEKASGVGEPWGFSGWRLLKFKSKFKQLFDFHGHDMHIRISGKHCLCSLQSTFFRNFSLRISRILLWDKMSTESILGEGGREKDPGLLNFCYATHLQ